MQAEQDNFTELLERYAPFFKWLSDSRCIHFAPPGFDRQPANGKLRFYVRKKLPASELKDDWRVLWDIYNGPQRTEFLNMDPKDVLIPRVIEGYATEVIEK